MEEIPLAQLKHQALAHNDLGQNGQKRTNTHPDDFRTLTQPEVGVSKTITATHRAIQVVPYRKQKTGCGYDSPTAHGDVTNLAHFAKNRKSPFCDVIISVSFNYIRFIVSGQ